MFFPKIIRWVYERHTSITLLLLLCRIALDIVRWVFPQGVVFTHFYPELTLILAVLFVSFGLLCPVVWLVAVKKKLAGPEQTPKEEFLAFLEMVVIPPLMAFEAVLSVWKVF